MSPTEHPKKFGRYELVSELGRGAMGVVYKARDSFLGRTVAVKTYRQDIAENESIRRRFEREVRTASRLQHPNIVTVYDGGLEEGIPFLAMELVEGTTLGDELERRGRLPLSEALGILDQVVAGLGCAHAQGVIHRDLKPANILLSTTGEAKIADFGVAKLATADTRATVNPVGTPSYMSPEQVRGKPVDGRADVFALGILAYELLTGEKPFSADTWTAVLFQILNTEPSRATEVRPELPRGLDDVLARAMSKEIAERTPDVATFGRELKAVFSEQTSATVAGDGDDERGSIPSPPPLRADPPPRREPTSDALDDGMSFDMGDYGPVPGMSPVRKKKPERRSESSNSLQTALLLLMVLGIGVILWQQGIFEGLPGIGTDPTPTPLPTPTAPPATATPKPVPTVTPKPTVRPTREPAPTTKPTPPPAAVIPPAAVVVPPTAMPKPVPTAPPAPTIPSGATMDVISAPTRATVWMNGELKGNTPVRIPGIPEGTYLVEIKLDGYVPYKRVAELEGNARYEMSVTLAPVVNSLRITSTPPGAYVVVNGVARGKTPVTLSGLKSGEYTVEVGLEGQNPHTRIVELGGGTLRDLKFELEAVKDPEDGSS